jgi:hypothetical protein
VLPVWPEGHGSNERVPGWPSKQNPQSAAVQFGTFQPVSESVVSNPTFDHTKKHLYQIVWTEDSISHFVDSNFVMAYKAGSKCRVLPLWRVSDN